MKLVSLERVATQTLLGVRFWDRLLERPVTDGLYVTAQRIEHDGGGNPTRRLGRAVVGQAASSGVIAFFGLHLGERVSPDPAQQLWETPPAPSIVAVDVTDRQRRYLPMSFEVSVPLGTRGAFKGNSALLRPAVPAGEEPGVYLWSAPARPALDGRAVICAQVVVGAGPQPAPAPYALVEISPAGGAVYSGLTDENGTLRLPMPYPPVPEPGDDEDYPPLKNQTFALDVKIYYQANQQKKLPGSDVPAMAALLNQAQARIGTHWNSAHPAALQTRLTAGKTLRFGEPLILRTAFGSANAEKTESFLRIVPV